ncbi:MAG: TonB C-terminal domain-containing protein [Puniceicoccales bacterium]|jgi:hypothetical protein|nr:TonB C-terminal domain-containing protein [Puniceicoccales bacterium]
MAHENSKGWVGSLLLHGLLAGALVAFSGLGARQMAEKKDPGSLVLVLNGDGSLAPGAGDGKSEIPEGRPDAAPPRDDLTEALKEIAKQVENLPPPTEPEPPPASPPKPDTKPITPPKDPKPREPEQMTLEQFKAKHPGNIRPKPPKPKGNNKSTGANKSAIVSQGLNISNIITGPLGVQGGAGLGGTPNGGGPIVAQYTQRLAMLIRAQWQHLLDLEGRSIPPGTSGKFLLSISNNGSISFAGWERSPGNAHFESLLRRAIDAVGNAGPRPPQTPSSVSFDIVASAP